MTQNWFGHTSPPLLWCGGGGNGFFRLPRILTPEERVLEDMARGGFPLFRKESCAPASAPVGTSVHAYLEKLLGEPVATLLNPRPAGRSAEATTTVLPVVNSRGGGGGE